MLIIKASLVVAILSSLVVLEADCGETMIEICRQWFDLDKYNWSQATVVDRKGMPVTINHPLSGSQCLYISHKYKEGTTSLLNVGEETATYVLRDNEGLSTEATTIEPGKLHTVYLRKTKECSIYIANE